MTDKLSFIKRFAAAFTALALTACATTTGAVSEPAYTVEVPDTVHFTSKPTKNCQGGCSFERGPDDVLNHEQIDALFDAVAKTPVGSESEALDQLLFHDTEVRNHLVGAGRERLPAEWATWLDGELSRTTVHFALRIIDESGKVRAEVPETAMALGVKLHMQVDDGDRTGPFNANGTIVRVAKDRVWYRM